ncbi:unnamed protein product [Rhizophagus irregularis]|nr:unnamed protein product [Rhizophagus irregularis]
MASTAEISNQSYPGQANIIAYLDSEDPSNWSFSDFLSSNFVMIVNSPPDTNDVNGLTGTWWNRFNLEVEAKGHKAVKNRRSDVQKFFYDVISARLEITRQQNIAISKSKVKIIADKQGIDLVGSSCEFYGSEINSEYSNRNLNNNEHIIGNNKRKRPAEEASRIITSPPNLRQREQDEPRTLENKIRTTKDTNGTEMEKNDSDIMYSDEESSSIPPTNVFSETSLSQQSHTDTTKVDSSLALAKEVGDMSASSAICNNESQDLDTQLETDTSFSEFDLVKFEEGYSKLDPNCMWTLESGRKVEEVIYEFARNLPGETCLHSFIINDAHADVKSLFSEAEWEEITALDVKENPKLERSHRELMIKYTVKSVKELREIIYDPFIPDGNKYDKSLHHDLDFINHAYRSMLFLWDREENPFDSSKLEGWYEMNVWSNLIDPTFHDIYIDLARGEGMSCASSDRKNIIRTINDRKKIGRKGDGVFRLRGDRLEFGAIEAGRKWEGQSGTKYLNDSLKLNKMMKDMIAQLTTICDRREDLVRKLEVIGILHGANRIQLITMDCPKGYISRVKHRKFYEVSGRLTKSNPLALVLKEILCAKTIILRTLDLINQKDDVDLENFLNDSDEQDGYRTPPPKVNIAPTFETQKTAKTKDVINKKK